MAWAVAGLLLAAVAPARGQAAGTAVPEVHFRLGAPELVQVAYPERSADPDRLARDVEWIEEEAGPLVAWWRAQGPLFLRRAADLAGLAWPYGDIEVYVVRTWPTVSIETPLVLALDRVEAGGRTLEVPRDTDVRTLLLAHQLVHWLLDDPPATADGSPDPVRDHPFLEPGPFDAEAMVNWVTYAALADLWGAERLARATESELWRAYNPSHDYVTEELLPHGLARTRSLADWLGERPPGDPAFAARDEYARRAEAAARPAPDAGPVEDLTGTEHGIDLGATYGGRVFVAYVDAGSPAARARVLQGDLLRTIEGRPVEDASVAAAQERLAAAWEDNREINLSVERGGREVFLTVQGR